MELQKKITVKQKIWAADGKDMQQTWLLTTFALFFSFPNSKCDMLNHNPLQCGNCYCRKNTWFANFCIKGVFKT